MAGGSVILWGWDDTNKVYLKVLVDTEGKVLTVAVIDKLNDIGDLNVPTPTDNDLLYWDAAAGKWQDIAHLGLPNAHHAQAHTLASHSTKAHGELSDAPENAHHTKFTTAEHTTIGNGAPHHAQAHDLASHTTKAHSELSDVTTAQHHTKYTDANAVSAIEAAGLTFAENKGIILDALLSGDEKWSGISEIGTMGYGATVGDLVYLAFADTKWELAKADVASTSKGKLGLVLATTSENSTCQVLLYGKMRSAAFPALTVGAPVHISAATAGEVVVAAPSGTTGFVVRIIGYGNTAEDLFFCPDNTYIELK